MFFLVKGLINSMVRFKCTVTKRGPANDTSSALQAWNGTSSKTFFLPLDFRITIGHIPSAGRKYDFVMSVQNQWWTYSYISTQDQIEICFISTWFFVLGSENKSFITQSCVRHVLLKLSSLLRWSVKLFSTLCSASLQKTYVSKKYIVKWFLDSNVKFRLLMHEFCAPGCLLHLCWEKATTRKKNFYFGLLIKVYSQIIRWNLKLILKKEWFDYYNGCKCFWLVVADYASNFSKPD